MGAEQGYLDINVPAFTLKPLMLKIMAGEFRSRKLLTPEDESVSRPYGSRVKESVFNLLRGWFEGATVIDIFAGVGTMGLECVSRGASKAFLIERDRRVFQLLESNIDLLKCKDRATAVCGDALTMTWMPRAPRPADLIFIDPPYGMMEADTTRDRVLAMAARCRTLMGDRGFMVLRSPLAVNAANFSIPGFSGPEVHSYGNQMHVLLYAPSPVPV